MLVAARINGLEIRVPKASDFVMGVTNKTPEFMARFPLGKVPALALSNGSSVFESDAIAQFVAESGPGSAQLLGATPIQRANIRQWICFAENEIMANLMPLVYWRVGLGPYEEGRETKAMERLERALATLEAVLGGENAPKSGWFIEGPEGKLSLADLSVASSLVWAFAQIIDNEMRGKYPKIVEWYLRVIGHADCQETFGEPGFIDVRKVGGAA